MPILATSLVLGMPAGDSRFDFRSWGAGFWVQSLSSQCFGLSGVEAGTPVPRASTGPGPSQAPGYKRLKTSVNKMKSGD